MGIPCACNLLISPNPIASITSDLSHQDKNKEFLLFDFKKHSQSVFKVFSQIRLNPKEHSLYISELLSKASPQITDSPIEKDDKLSEYLSPNTSSFLISFLSKHEDMRSILNELLGRLAAMDIRPKAIEWDEDLYQGFISASSEDKQNYSFLFNRLLLKNLRIVQYTIEGHYEPEIVPWLLILQNKEKTYDILTDDYINYFVHSSSLNSQFITDFFFIYINPKDVLINGYNPMTGNFQPFSLNEDFFKNIKYKDDIVSGSYIFIGNVLNVNFQLCNGDKKEENLNVSKDIL